MATINQSVKTVSLDSVAVQIFVAGGRGVGESVTIIILDGRNVVFSMVIDSCLSGDAVPVVLPLRILESFNVQKVDCIVWSHPHDDHSVGLDQIVTKFYQRTTIGILPKQLYTEENSIVSVSGICRHVLKTFNKRFSRKNLRSIDCQEGESRPLLRFTLKDSLTGKEKPVVLYCMTPIDYFLDDKLRKGRKYSKSLLNELSLTLVLDIDGYRFYFGGDAPDKMILKSNNDDLRRCRWIKIPHHASYSSQGVIPVLNCHIDSAVTTAFLSESLPKLEVLNKYAERSDHIFVTQKSSEDVHPYGVIEYEYKFGGPSVELQIRYFGNAYKYGGN